MLRTSWNVGAPSQLPSPRLPRPATAHSVGCEATCSGTGGPLAVGNTRHFATRSDGLQRMNSSLLLLVGERERASRRPKMATRMPHHLPEGGGEPAQPRWPRWLVGDGGCCRDRLGSTTECGGHTLIGGADGFARGGRALTPTCNARAVLPRPLPPRAVSAGEGGRDRSESKGGRGGPTTDIDVDRPGGSIGVHE